MSSRHPRPSVTGERDTNFGNPINGLASPSCPVCPTALSPDGLCEGPCLCHEGYVIAVTDSLSEVAYLWNTAEGQNASGRGTNGDSSYHIEALNHRPRFCIAERTASGDGIWLKRLESVGFTSMVSASRRTVGWPPPVR
jgi:hypothetical protein